MFGDKGKLASLHDDFFRRVAGPFGVRRAPAKMSVKERKMNAEAVLLELQRTNAPELRGALWPVTWDNIRRNPGPYLELLGLEAHRQMRTMAQVFTSKGAGSLAPENCYSTSPHVGGRSTILC